MAAPPPARQPGVHPARRSITRPRLHHATPPRRASHAASPRHQPPSGALADGPCWRQRSRLRRCGGPSAGAQADPRRGCRHASPSRGCRRRLSSASSPRVQALRRPRYRVARLRLMARAAGGSSWRSLVLDDEYTNKGMFLDTLEQLDEMTRTTGTNTLTGNHGYIVLSPDKLDLIWLLQ